MDADAARRRQLFETGGHIDAITVNVGIVLDDDVAEVDTDAECHAPLLGDAGVALGHGILDRYRAFDRAHDTRELDQGAIAHQLHDPTAGRHDPRLDHLLAMGLERHQVSGLVLLHQVREADHVGSHDRGEASQHDEITLRGT